MEKRGQVTIYVVIGIAIVAIAILIYNFRQDIFISQWEKEQQASLTVPEKVNDVQRFVLECIEQTGTDAANIMGFQGGYIEVPEDKVPPMPNNPFSNALRIFPKQDYVAPYWFYKSSNGVFKTIIPSKQDMEAELATYMDENMARCTLNFTMFEEFNISVGEIKSKAEIRDTKILFTVDYPVTVQIEDFTFRFPSFYQDVQVGLGKLYNIAKELLAKSKDDTYLEEFTIDILALNPNIPFSGTEDSCVPKFWNIDNVRSEFKTSLDENVPYIKVDGTSFTSRSNYFVWDALRGSYGDVRVDFKYSPSWPLYLEAYPSEDGILTAEPLSNPEMEELAYVSSFLCFMDYNFVYDITYPLLIALTDENGYVFEFAAHVVIDNNQPKENILGEDDYPDEKPLICEAPVTPLTIYAMEGDTLRNLDGVTIKLKCISTVCSLGKTLNNNYGDASLVVKSPACVNALMTADKPGYHKGGELVDTTESGSITILIDRYRELPYQIKLVEESGYVRDPAEEEAVIITLNENTKKYSTSLVTGSDITKVKLIPGSYDVSAYVSASSPQGFYIEGRNFDKCVETPKSGFMGLFFSVKDETCYTAEVPGMTLDQVVTGGAKFGWQVLSSNLDTSSKVIFYVPVKNVPRNQDEILAVQESIEGSSTVIYPEFAA
ncbi:MAG: hypothetical protein V1906_02910 [Candidatus Woesearchaeota archaeon]